MLSSFQLSKKPYLLLLVLLGVEALMMLLAYPRVGVLKFEPKLEVLAFFTVAGFAVTLFQLAQGQLVQKAKFLTDYVSQIHTDPEISSAFHDLVATYEDKTFDVVASRVADYELTSKKEDKPISRPLFEPFKDLQDGREAGSRYYHPIYFQGSSEERRLDGLLGYLDIIDYHHYYGLIRTKDVAAMLNYQLAAMASRKVIQTYLQATGEAWFNSTTIRKGSSANQIPFIYLRNMLGQYVLYNQENEQILKAEQDRIANKLRGRFL
jgi:hypothetical protein